MEYFDRINNPRTEGNFIEELNFFINFAVFEAADEYIGWAGVVDCETEVDVGKIEARLNVECLKRVFDRQIPVLRERFGAPDPYEGDVEGFIDWYRAACERNGIGKIFSDVFRKFFTSK